MRIFVKNNLKFNQLNVTCRCKEEDTECCVIPLASKHSNMFVLATHRATKGDFEIFKPSQKAL